MRAAFRHTALRFWVVGLLMLWVGAAAAANPQFPALTGRIVDDAHVLSPGAVKYLDDRLEAYENGTTNQVAVVTLNGTGGESLENYTNLLFRHWALGQKGKDNGVLIAVSPGERRMHIEVGYRLEPVLTDAATSEIINEIMLPAFKEGDMDRGIINGTQAVLSVLGGHSVPVAHMHSQGAQQPSFMQSAFGFIVLIMFLLFAVRHPFLAMLLLSNSRYGSSSGGSDWDDSGGGFKGGGGSAGGGGASGSW